jgi:enoyl-CoA hydratase
MTVRVERAGNVWTVVLDRPEVRNAVDGPTAHALAEAFAEFDGDDSADVAVLWGAGGTFCAGADLHQMSNPLDPDMSAVGPMGPSRMALSKPVVAAVAGHAVAGGLELALWCDLRVVEEDAVLGVFCRRWGVPLIDGGTVRLPRIVGIGRALDLILTGRPVHADEALAMGLANRVVPRGESRAAAEALAAEIARFPAACMRSDRRSLYDAAGLDETAALASEFAHGSTVLAEALRGAQRFAGGAGRGGSFEDL